jgi:hypothetical protein
VRKIKINKKGFLAFLNNKEKKGGNRNV